MENTKTSGTTFKEIIAISTLQTLEETEKERIFPPMDGKKALVKDDKYIGYLCGYLGDTPDKPMHKTWHTGNKELRTTDFQKELNTLIHGLRLKKFKDVTSLVKYCGHVPKAQIFTPFPCYGFKYSSLEYDFYMRFQFEGDYNFFIFCYRKDATNLVTPELIERLDRKNQSKNTDLTKARFKEDFSLATSEKKKEIVSLSGRTFATLYKIYTDGNISIRVLTAASFILNASPYWYSGEAETKEDFSDELMRKFLKEKGYKAALQEPEKEKKKKEPKHSNSRPQRHNVDPVKLPRENIITEDSKAEKIPAQEDWRKSDNFQELSMDDAMKLLEALYIRAEINPSEMPKLHNVFELLLS